MDSEPQAIAWEVFRTKRRDLILYWPEPLGLGWLILRNSSQVFVGIRIP